MLVLALQFSRSAARSTAACGTDRDRGIVELRFAATRAPVPDESTDRRWNPVGLDTAGSGSLKTEERTQGPSSSQAMGAEAATTHHPRGRTRQCTN
jgi:hypothetical protein